MVYKLIKKPIVAVVSIVLTMFIVVSLFNIVIYDWNYSHKTYGVSPKPVNWFLYKVEFEARQFLRGVFGNNEVGLPQVHLYINESSINRLKSNIPDSTKEWQKGFILNENNDLQKIKIKHKGGNPSNWMFEYKSWRIKTKKNEMFDRTRVLNYSYPQLGLILTEYSPASLARRIGVLSPKVRLVELFINDESSGVYIETEQLNESFLRKNNIMPVNLYKGEQIYSEDYIGISNKHYNNPSLWSKKAFFNKVSKGNKSDLKYILKLIRSAETSNLDFEELSRYLDFNIWSLYVAYQEISQNYHAGDSHNIRLVIDPWSGKVMPIVHDALIPPISISFKPLTRINENERYNVPRDGLIRLLLKSSVFIHEKNKKLFHFTMKDPVLLSEYKHIQKLEDEIDISIDRDIDRFKLLKHGKWFENKNLFNVDGMRSARRAFASSLLDHQNNIKTSLLSKPYSAWDYHKDKLTIVVSGKNPVSNIKVDFSSEYPEWIVLDLNNNGIIDNDDKKFYTKEGSVSLPFILYPNFVETKAISTGFEFLLPQKANIKSVSYHNPFSSSKYIMDQKYLNYVLPSKYNEPISIRNISSTIKKHKKIFSGVVNIYQNTHIFEPVDILPGTVIKLSPGASLVFHNKVMATGEPDLPISFERTDSNSAWGTIALQGKGTRDSVLRNVDISGGSGDIVNNIHYTSMLSLHDTENVRITNSRLFNNEKYDDMLHVVYGKNIILNNVLLQDAIFDAIDIDMSKGVILKNVNVINAGNDAIDFMETEALVDNAYLFRSGDKGISAGENSNILIYNSLLRNNAVGLASKDMSNTQVLYSNFDSNRVQISLYKKNWHYNDGGHAQISNSKIINGIKQLNMDSNSTITFKNMNDFDGYSEYDANNTIFVQDSHPLYSFADKVKSEDTIGFQGND